LSFNGKLLPFPEEKIYCKRPALYFDTAFLAPTLLSSILGTHIDPMATIHPSLLGFLLFVKEEEAACTALLEPK
jgi:hypothetical protein